jgi:hypothetical protein
MHLTRTACGRKCLTKTTGVRRQPRHPIPRDLREERHQRRAGFLDHGPPNQGAYGNHNRQHQANRPDRTRTGCTEWIRWWLLLERYEDEQWCAGHSSGEQDEQYTAWVFCDFGNGNLMLMVMAMASTQRLFMSTHPRIPRSYLHGDAA